MLRRMVPAAVLALINGVAAAQDAQPYAGLQDRPIKALSAEEVSDLKAGRGMGLALAAELNGYPGPRHVLELAEQLDLSGEQRARVEALFSEMQAETISLGERLISQESALDRQFADRSVTPVSLIAATEAIGATQAALRAAHLRYHLSMMDVLTPEQVQRYAELRGYTETGSAQHGGKGHAHPN